MKFRQEMITGEVGRLRGELTTSQSGIPKDLS